MSARFCAQCGARPSEDARFCSQCGFAVGGAASPAVARGWRPTAAGASVFGTFVLAGLAIWASILSPEPPRPAPGGATPQPGAPPAQGATSGSLPPDHPTVPLELPEEVKTFIDTLSASAKDKPDDKAAWLRLAQVYYRAAQIDPSYGPEALAAYDHVLARHPDDVEALRGKANIFYDRSDHAQAIPLYEKLLTLAPGDPNVRTDLATMYLYAGNPERAIAAYEEVIADHPEFLQAHYNLAVTFAQLGRVDEALARLEKARPLATEPRVQRQVDDMIARLRTGAATPGAATPGTTGAAPAAAPSTPASPFQTAVEKELRAHPILGPRVVRVEWSASGSGRVIVRSFPMDGMPPPVRDKFTGRIADTLRQASAAQSVDGEVKLEFADVESGKVMATVTP
jgi:tetratricopeptide (TPR) repeat protein